MELPLALYVVEILLRLVMVLAVIGLALAILYAGMQVWEFYAVRRETRSILAEVSCSCGDVVIGPKGHWPSAAVLLGGISHNHDGCQPLTEALP